MAGRRVDSGEVVDVKRSLSSKLGWKRLANIELDKVHARHRETRRYDVDAIELIVELLRGEAFQQMAADETRPTKDDRISACHGINSFEVLQSRQTGRWLVKSPR